MKKHTKEPDRKKTVQKKVKKRKAKHAGRVALHVLLALLIVAAALFVFVFFFCEVESVEYEGNRLYGDEVFSEALFSDEYSSNAIYCYFKYRFFEEVKLPFVEKVTVSLKDKNSLVVTVTEDERTGMMVDASGSFVYFNSENTVVEVSEVLLEGVPLVAMADVELDGVTEGERLPLKSKRDKELKKVFSCLKEQGIAVSNVLFSEDGSIEMGYGDITINLGPATNVEAKMVRLKYILSQLSGEKGTLHLEDWDVGTRDIVFERSE